MVQLHNVSYETPNHHLFHDVSFSINTGDRIGLVGLNGVGKTTLLSIVNGDIEQTSGSILSYGETIGIVLQDMSAWLDRTVYDFLEEATGIKQVREQLEEQCRNLAIDSSEKSLLLYAEALEKYNKFETSSFDTNIERVLTQAGLARINGDYKIGDLSGGQRTRIALAAIFVAKYDVILLDEPTNNLDQSGVAMLEEFIKSSPASFLIVSHDRRFLRNVTTQIIELTYGDKGIRQYSLGYDEYVEARKREKESIVHTYEQYEREKGVCGELLATRGSALIQLAAIDMLLTEIASRIIFVKNALLRILRVYQWQLVAALIDLKSLKDRKRMSLLPPNLASIKGKDRRCFQCVILLSRMMAYIQLAHSHVIFARVIKFC